MSREPYKVTWHPQQWEYHHVFHHVVELKKKYASQDEHIFQKKNAPPQKNSKREFLFKCTSVAITRGNPMILSTLRQSWQQQPSANTKCGKPHRATLKAGLWDEPPQLARALATGF